MNGYMQGMGCLSPVYLVSCIDHPLIVFAILLQLYGKAAAATLQGCQRHRADTASHASFDVDDTKGLSLSVSAARPRIVVFLLHR
jgi:hypothetical protein